MSGYQEPPAMEVGTSLSARRVTRVLDEVIDEREAQPDRIRVENVPEFTSRCFLAWAEQRGIELIHIQPVQARAEQLHREFQRATA